MGEFFQGLIIGGLAIPAWALIYGLWCHRHGWWEHLLLSDMAQFGGVLLGLYVFRISPRHETGYTAAAFAWFLVWLWHRTKGDRKRAAELAGAKTRALRDALVRKTRESLQPRPVLRPVPVR